MKKIISAAMVLFVVSGIIFPVIAVAAARKTINNCGYSTFVTYIEENGKKYIDALSIRELELDLENLTDRMYLRTNSKEVQIHRGSSTVLIDGTSIFYKNPMIEKNGREYISLDLIVMLFSANFEETEDSINLWITYYPANSAKGVISLPNGETAPNGGVEVSVYVLQKKTISYSLPAVPTVGFGIDCIFDDNPFNFEFIPISEEKILIEEGGSRAEFFLTDAGSDFGASCYIGYRVDDKGYLSEGLTNFNFKEEKSYDFTINKNEISGTVEVPKAPDEDTRFRIKATGGQNYETYGVIPKGETSSDYRISVPDGTYKLSIVFENKAYKKTDYSRSVEVSGKSAQNTDFSCELPGKISVKLTVSEPAEDDIPVNLFIQSADKPYYCIDVQDAMICCGEKSAYAELNDEIGCDNLICFYELESEKDGLNDFGFYNEQGTVYKIESAQRITADADISMELLKAQSSSENLNLEAWAEDDKAYISIKNQSVFDRKNINVYLASYNSGKLAGLDMATVPKLLKGSSDIVYFDIPRGDTVKAFAWCGMQPYSGVEYLKKNGIYYNCSAQIRLCAGSMTMYNRGKEVSLDNAPIMKNGCLMTPIRPFAEALNCSVNWDSATDTAVFSIGKDNLVIQLNNKTAFCNGAEFKLSEPMCISDEIIYVPAADIAERFGYTSDFNTQTNELFLYVDEAMQSVNEAKTYGDLPVSLFLKDMTAPVSKIDAAQILAALCELISATELDYSEPSVYTDTDDINVLKVSEAGILKGDSDTAFSPDRILTNAEFAEALYRAMLVSGENPVYKEDTTEKFYDDNDISIYVKDLIYSLKEYGAFVNVYGKIFSSDSPITLKKAVAAVQNCLGKAYYSLFCDVAPDSPYRKAITKLYRMEIVGGYEDGSYRPDEFYTRAEASALITRMQGGSIAEDFSCKDVSDSHWSHGYVGYCINSGIMDLQDGKFFPDDHLVSIDAASAMLRILGYTDFTSENEISEAAVSIGLTEGIDKFDGDSPISREKFAQLVYNTLKIGRRI